MFLRVREDAGRAELAEAAVRLPPAVADPSRSLDQFKAFKDKHPNAFVVTYVKVVTNGRNPR